VRSSSRNASTAGAALLVAPVVGRKSLKNKKAVQDEQILQKTTSTADRPSSRSARRAVYALMAGLG
jgi:hypothetical protein